MCGGLQGRTKLDEEGEGREVEGWKKVEEGEMGRMKEGRCIEH